jgi:hypothetical protein
MTELLFLTRKTSSMTGNKTPASDHSFSKLLAVHGADQSRWPAEGLRQWGELTADPSSASGAAVRLALAEAQALDAVLARASTIASSRQTALADRIMAAVVSEADGATAADVAIPAEPSNVVALPVRPARRGASHHIGSAPYGIDWRAAAALAAALVLGIGVGLSGTASPTFQAVVETVGSSLDRSLDRSVLALNDEPGGTLAALDDEDVL